MPFFFEGKQIDDYQVSGIDGRDAPDFTDAFIEKAWFVIEGKHSAGCGAGSGELTEQELDRLNESDLRYEMVWEYIH